MGTSSILCQYSLLLALSIPLVTFAEPLCHDNEKSALLQFKQSFLVNCDLAGDPATAFPKLKSWESENKNETSDCCTWDGVECDKQTGFITGLDLVNSCLYGTFPSNISLFNLIHLRNINLAFNNFNYSRIPRELAHLNKLTSLNLSSSLFSGRIPSEISKLSRLSSLDLSNNVDPLSGNLLLELRDPSLEKLVGNMTRLNVLSLDQVDISSAVPIGIGNLTSLQVISLGYCNLHGEFPSSVFQLPKLETLILSGNTELVGSLPEFQPNSPLRGLHLDLTGFSGDLPSSIGGLGSLEKLILWNCHFSGEIPATLGNLTSLTDLNLGYNNFIEEIPLSVTNLIHLNSLDVSLLQLRYSNLITWLVQLNKLTVLSLRGMDLAGEIPSPLVNLTQMRYLDLSENQLMGSIPSWLGNLTQLTDLYLDANQLQGPIPELISQLPNLGSLGLSYNKDLFGSFDTFLKLKKLTVLQLSGVNLHVPPNTNTNISSSVKFTILGLDFCNITKFPQFLQDQDQIKSLSLSGNRIQGNIPKWFMNTAKESLMSLDLSDNSLTGFEQPLLDLPWSNLEVLDLSRNRLRGHLPNPPTSMLLYKVSGNLFTGLVPKQICGLTSLNILDFSDNNLSGSIPSCLGDQLSQSLLVLNLRGNSFSGTIPPSYPRSCTLKMINLSENQLQGKLPRSLINCKMLEVLDVGKNSINDTFPSWLGSLSDLQVLVLRHNNFIGTIPSPRTGYVFPSLRIIDLSNNFCNGYLPTGYFQHWDLMKVSDDQNQSTSSGGTITVNFLISGVPYVSDERYTYSITITNKGNEMLYPKVLNVFRVIDFSSNEFNGKIPDSIGELRGLQALNLSNNNLDGRIPSSLSNVRGLESLDVSQNALSGEIPRQLSELTSLEVFDVSRNALVGPIPHGKQFNTFDESSYDGNSRLCGSPLSKMCGDSDEIVPLSSETNDDSDDESELIDWVFRLLGCLSGFAVGFLIGKFYITDKNHEWFVHTFGWRKSDYS